MPATTEKLVYIYSNRNAVAAAVRDQELKMFIVHVGYDADLRMAHAGGAPQRLCGAWHRLPPHCTRRGARCRGRVCAVTVVTSAGEASTVVTEPSRAGQGSSPAA